MSWDATNHYYSGQGVVMLAQRDANGKPKGFTPIGNVSDLKISVAVSTLEHKESQTGQRATDLRLTTETKCSLSMTVENFIAQNLADALRGDSATIAGDDATDEVVAAYPGKIVGLKYAKVSDVTAKVDSVSMTAFTDEDTEWDYRVNAESGSIMWNDGSIAAQPLDKLGVVASDVTVGTTTTITVDNNCAEGDVVSFRGFTGADAALINDKSFVVLAATGTEIEIGLASSNKVITDAADSYVTWQGMPATVSYTYASQYRVDALTQGAKELYMRFEGLNTAEGNAPVVVEVYKFLTDPLKELSLISDAIQQFTLEGSVLADPLQTTGSKFFNVTKLN